MRALRFDGSDRSVSLVRDAAEPACAPGEALVRPIKVSPGPADLSVDPDRAPGASWTLGHEFVGVVESVDIDPEWTPRVRERFGAMRGQRVVVSKTIVCGQCDMCLRGLRAHCRNQSILGANGRDGAFADLVVAPAMNLVPVPDEVDDERAVFAELVAASLHAAQQIPLEHKTYVTVLGDSVIALLCAQVMTRRNASVRVVGFDERTTRLCDKWGVRSRSASEIGRRADQDVVVECSGTPAGLALSLELVRARGHVILKKPFPASAVRDTPLTTRSIVERELTIVGSRSGSLSEALEALRRGEVDVAALIGARTRLDDGPGILDRAAEVAPLKLIVDV